MRCYARTGRGNGESTQQSVLYNNTVEAYIARELDYSPGCQLASILNKRPACWGTIRYFFPLQLGASLLRGPDTYGATNELMANHGAYYIVDIDIMAARPARSRL
ncbi:hypothetical protein BaRGS_00013199 [Batillaria attramentaria]|uniref:Uncharacterized protein n=1 Tax=Batillaria attramentaria TaxID=370345 RepID=A0ABD0L8B3_9CAEN